MRYAVCGRLRGKEIREREGKKLPQHFYPQKGKYG